MTIDELKDGISALLARSNGSLGEKIELGPEPTLGDIPIELSKCLLARMQLGRTNYGDFNQWKQRMSRPGYRRKRIKNTFDHLYNIATSNFEEDDLYGNIGGVLFGCMVLLEFMKVDKAKKAELDAIWAAQQAKFDALNKRHEELNERARQMGIMENSGKHWEDTHAKAEHTSLMLPMAPAKYCDCVGVCVPFHIKLCPVCQLTVIRNMEA